jgi:TolB-like protein
MAKDIITALSRFKSLFVIARNSSFTTAVQTMRLADALGLDFAVAAGHRYVNDAQTRENTLTTSH